MIKQFSYISILLLFGTFLNLPYGYYQFLRIFLTISAIYYLYLQKDIPYYFFGWLIVAIIYNPILPLYFTRSNWGIINITTILFTSFWVYKTKRT